MGPFLKLRGITQSQISSKYAFIIYLVFSSKDNPANIIKIPAICEATKALSQSINHLNNIDFDCIGAQEIEDNYILTNIEGENIYNDIFMKIVDPAKTKSNFDENNYNLFMIFDLKL